MVCLFSYLRAASHMCSGAGNGSGTVGNRTDRQPGGLFPRGHRFHSGIGDYVFLIFSDCKSYFKGEKEQRQLAWLRQLTGRYRFWILGILLIVPLVSDEILCAGSVFLKISLPQFLKIGIIAKIISIGMIAFSGFLGGLCGLGRWQMIAGELLLMLLASAALQHFCKKGEAKLS